MEDLELCTEKIAATEFRKETDMGLDMSLVVRRESGNKEEVCYWRKANAIHRYFTEDYKERGYSSDNCTEFEVDENMIKELIVRCARVLVMEEEGEDVLPTEDGFFFGGTEYDEYYRKQLLDTILMLRDLYKDDVLPLGENESMYYLAWY